MLATEILPRELMFMDAVQGGATVRDRTYFVGVKLFPPIQRAGDVNIDDQHPHELPMVRTSIPQPGHEIEVVGANCKVLIWRSIVVNPAAITTVFVRKHIFSALIALLR